ncbi:hypothetical protein AY599_28060 [Leptolyngbya valderiana BDU 20041]|nr:hypothetical protein AY599_28060 [Leptolyngbya valderiana BDU 20041]
METLVAMALLAIAIIPLYVLMQTLADGAARIESVSEMLSVEESALAVLETFDPMAEPNGERMLGDWRLTWTSERIADESPASGYMGVSIYRMSLFDVTATLQRGDRSRTIRLRRVGWVQVTDPLTF